MVSALYVKQAYLLPGGLCDRIQMADLIILDQMTEKKSKKLIFYIFRWQLSTPILYAVLAILPYGDMTNTVIANFIGALVFFPADELIFNRKK